MKRKMRGVMRTCLRHGTSQKGTFIAHLYTVAVIQKRGRSYWIGYSKFRRIRTYPVYERRNAIRRKIASLSVRADALHEQ